MAGREVREYTNLSDPKGKYENRNLNRRFLICSFYRLKSLIADKRWGKGKDKLDDEDIAFQRMVAKVRASPLPSFPYLLDLIIISLGFMGIVLCKPARTLWTFSYGFFSISFVLMESAVCRSPYHFSERALVVLGDTMAGVISYVTAFIWQRTIINSLSRFFVLILAS